MAVFEWHDRLLTGIAQIDDHHRHLVGLLNTTYRDFLRHAPPDLLSELFEDLIDYATYHFTAEENLMEKAGYPQTAEHKQAHATFIKRVNEMHAGFLEKQTPFFLEILAFLQSWLESHIIQTDGNLGRFLALTPRESTGK